MKHADIDFDPELDRLEHLSNGILDLIAAKRFDEAAASCETLRRDFPDHLDWMERAAMLQEAKGEIASAIDHYEKCIQFIRRNADGFDPDSVEWYREKVEQLRG